MNNGNGELDATGSQHRPSRIPLGMRALLGLSCLLMLAVISGVAALSVVFGLVRQQSRVDKQAVPYAAFLAAAALDAKGVANDQRGFLLTGDRSFIAEADQRIIDTRAAFDAAESVAPDSDVAAVRSAAEGFERWVAAVRAEFDRYLAGDRTGAVNASLGADRAMRKSYEEALAQVQTLADQAIESARRTADRESTWSIMTLAAVLVAGVVIGVVVIVWLMRTIALPVSRLVALLTPDLA